MCNEHRYTPWFDELKLHCCQLICTGDQLLSRYRKSKRKVYSPAAGCFYRCLQLVQRICFDLSGDEQSRLMQLEAALEERMLLFRHHRGLPSPLLRKLRRQEKALEQFLSSAPVSAPQWDAPDVLVGTLRNPTQLEICLNHSFYHVPVCQIPDDRQPIRYVAIYQSRTMFPDSCGIHFYGKVRKCVKLPRWKIFEIPKSSDEPYYRLEIERWELLDQPVQVREIPFTHLFTNLFLLRHSRETPELELRTPEQFHCYQALKLAADWNKGPVYQNAKGKIRLRRKRFLVYPKHGKMKAFSTEDFKRTPSAIFHQIYRLLNPDEK
jgi:hypothetical protein